jgi:hypothetical protein
MLAAGRSVPLALDARTADATITARKRDPTVNISTTKRSYGRS